MLEVQIYKDLLIQDPEKRDVLKSNLDNYLEERSHEGDVSFDTGERAF